ncbi:MAG: PQQ-binding-like beta-propeller repeat protein [Candidatus Krumholzibacteria bacterium]|nr:PQQ-binding-like beta-propeller repeat protein [Candidatus Krumholzibacteria bacterium]
MGRTCFIAACGGEDTTALTYHETSRRTGRKEFFVFIQPARPEHGDALRELFRRIVSSSRLGHPARFFEGIIDAMNALPGAGESDSHLVDSMILVVMRLGEEYYVLRNRRIEPVHYDASRGSEGAVEAIPGRREIPLERTGRQGELFATQAQDHFILERFAMPTGAHTILMTPSREFVQRFRGVLLDSILMPSFEVPSGGEIQLETNAAFPAIHWKSIGTGGPARQERKRGSDMIKRSAPIIAGAVALIAAVILIFNPFDSGRRTEPGEEILLGAGESEGEQVPAPAGTAPAAAMERPGERAEPMTAVAILGEGWRKKFNAPVTSSPAVCGDRVTFGCRDGNIYSFSTDGTMQWTYRAEEGVGASPLCVGGRVIGADYKGNVFCLDGGAGTLVWSFQGGEKIVSSPQAAGRQVIVCTMGGRVIALDAENGQRIWSQKIGESVWATPAVGGNFIVAASTDGSLVRLSRDGAVVWRIAPGGTIHSSPLCLEDEDLVIVGSGDSCLFGYSLKDGTLRWRFAAGSEIRSAPASSAGRIFVGTEAGDLVAVDLLGREAWRRNTGAAIRSRPLVVQGVVFVTSYNSKLSAFAVLDGSPLGDYRADSPLYSSPAFHHGRIYFGSNGGFLHAPSVTFAEG